MNETTKVMSRTILLEIEKATNILLHLHPSPDGDSVGSALAMMMALELMGKKVTLISGDSNPPSTLAALPGFEKIINRPIGKTDLGEYQLFLILDSASMTQVTRKTTLEIPEEKNVDSLLTAWHRAWLSNWAWATPKDEMTIRLC